MSSGSADVKAVHLHIGAMKTGTSYVQGNLEECTEALAAAGVLFPGSVGAAVHDVLEKRGARHLGQSSGAWNTLVDTIAAWSGPTAVVSMEFLGLATPAQVERIVTSLQPADVRVVLTARDLARTLPSAWQQTTKNRRTLTWPTFLAAVSGDADGRDRVRERFWQHHDIPAIAKRWAQVVGPDHLTVVTVPRSGQPTLLWDRFCEAVGLDSADYPVTSGHAWNLSLGFAEAEMLRLLNLELGRDIEQPAYRKIVTEYLSGDVLRGSAELTSKMVAPRLPQRFYTWATGRAQEVVADLERLGPRVIGDLTELLPGPRDEVAEARTSVAPADVTTVAIRSLAALVMRLAEVVDQETEASRP